MPFPFISFIRIINAIRLQKATEAHLKDRTTTHSLKYNPKLSKNALIKNIRNEPTGVGWKANLLPPSSNPN